MDRRVTSKNFKRLFGQTFDLADSVVLHATEPDRVIVFFAHSPHPLTNETERERCPACRHGRIFDE